MKVPFLRRSLAALVIINLAAVLTLAQTRENTRSTGVITGRVTIGEKPAVGVLVGLTRAQINSPNDGGTLAKATTDADGRYRLTGVPTGSFRLSPLAPGYVSPTDNPGFFEQGQVVNVREDETVEGLDFTLTRGGVITGKIMDGNGKPLIEQQLNVWKLESGGRKSNWYPPSGSFSMMTDDRGIYRLYGLPAGRYLISAGQGGSNQPGPPNRGGIIYKRTFYPDATDESQAKPIEVTPGSEAKEIDIRLAGETLKGHTVTVRVVDAETGAPLPGANVGYGPVVNDRVNSYFIIVTDGAGVAMVSGLPQGRYGATFMAPRGSTQPSEYFSETTFFEVGEGDIEGVEVRAQHGATITGKVVLEGTTDLSLLAQLVKLRVVAFSRPIVPGAPSIPVRGYGVTLNQDGSFRASALPPGRVQFNAGLMAGDPVGFMLLRTELDGVPQKDGIEVAAGQQVANARLVFAYGQAVVRGQVQLVGGALPEGVTMSVYARRTDVQILSGIRPAQVDARGRLTLEGLAAGEYELVLTASPRMVISVGPDGNSGTSSATPGFPRTIRQKITVPQTGEVSVTLTLDLTPKENK
jgi:hypothetical protein